MFRSASSGKNLKREGGGGGETERGEVQNGRGGRGGGQRGEEDCTISAGKRRALVHSLLAVESGVAAGTLAHVAAAIVLLPALAAVETGGVGARQQAVLTVGALELFGARALVAGLQILKGLQKKKDQKTKMSCVVRRSGM